MTNQIDQILDNLTPEVQARLLELVKLEKEYISSNKLDQFFTDTGPGARDKYPVQIEFMKATKDYNELAFIAANQSGKTLTCAYIMAVLLTGKYPHWWEGKRYDHPIRAWAISISSQRVRDNIQKYLLGPLFSPGTGFIPKDYIVDLKPSQSNLSGLYGDIAVKHFTDGVEDGISWLSMKSYLDGRGKFQGEQVDVAWFDEEDKSQQGIYGEVWARGLTRDMLIICSFTPLEGLSDMTLDYIPDLEFPMGGYGPSLKPGRYVANVTWDDVPHITEKKKNEAESKYSESEYLARSRGIPGLGAGLIWPVAQDTYNIKPTQDLFYLIERLPRAYAMDVAYTSGITAALWGAYDELNDTLYIYDEYYTKGASVADHVSAIKSKGGVWMSGVVDPSSQRKVSQHDHRRILEMYNQEGLYLSTANNAVFAGIESTYARFLSGRLKVVGMRCPNLMREIRLYRRDEKGEIVKKDDHACDCLRYMVMSGISACMMKPEEEDKDYDSPWNRRPTNRDKYTGY